MKIEKNHFRREFSARARFLESVWLVDWITADQISSLRGIRVYIYYIYRVQKCPCQSIWLRPPLGEQTRRRCKDAWCRSMMLSRFTIHLVWCRYLCKGVAAQRRNGSGCDWLYSNQIKWPNIPQTDIFALDSLDHCLLLPQRSLAKGKHWCLCSAFSPR